MSLSWATFQAKLRILQDIEFSVEVKNHLAVILVLIGVNISRLSIKTTFWVYQLNAKGFFFQTGSYNFNYTGIEVDISEVVIENRQFFLN